MRLTALVACKTCGLVRLQVVGVVARRNMFVEYADPGDTPVFTVGMCEQCEREYEESLKHQAEEYEESMRKRSDESEDVES